MKVDYSQKQKKKLRRRQGITSHMVSVKCKEVDICSVVIRSGYDMVRCTYSLDHMAAV